MSLFDSASLVVTPNGYKEDKLYSIKPTDGSGDLVVTRATTATRVSSAGLVELVPYNLATYSEDFTNSDWIKGQTTVTANSTIAPNGTTTADTIFEASTTNTHNIASNYLINFVSGSSYTISIYAKNNTNGRGLLQIAGYALGSGASNIYANFNLSNGTLGSVSGGNSTITAVDNGFYRLTFSFICGNTISERLNYSLITSLTSTAFQSYLGDSSKGIIFWGAQLVSGTSAKEYFPTTDRLNVPRLDYTNSTCPSILVEPQRTNITLQSENLATTWYTANGLLTSNATTAPDGTTTADKIKADTTNGIHVYQQTLTVSNATAYTMSVFVKAGEYTFFELADASNLKGQTFNLTAKTISAPQTGGFSAATSSKIEDYGNGWLRCSITYTTVGVTAFFRMSLSNGTTTSFAGNNTNGLFVWGAQLEAGSYATSYIPTVASSVTRNADVISKTGISSLIGQTEGVMYFDLKSIANNDFKRLSINGGSYVNSIFFDFDNSNSLYAKIFVGGSAVATLLASGVNIANRNKIAIAYKNNDFSFYVNGTQVASQSSGSIPSGLANYEFSLAGNQIFEGNINAAALWKTRLTNTELATLTTI